MKKNEMEIWSSPVLDCYNEKFVEDCYIDSYSGIAQGKSFGLQVTVVSKPRFFLKPEVGFMVTICIFETPTDLHLYVKEMGEDKFIELYYSTRSHIN